MGTSHMIHGPASGCRAGPAPRNARADVGGLWQHTLNRGNRREPESRVCPATVSGLPCHYL